MTAPPTPPAPTLAVREVLINGHRFVRVDPPAERAEFAGGRIVHHWTHREYVEAFNATGRTQITGTPDEIKIGDIRYVRGHIPAEPSPMLSDALARNDRQAKELGRLRELESGISSVLWKVISPDTHEFDRPAHTPISLVRMAAAKIDRLQTRVRDLEKAVTTHATDGKETRERLSEARVREADIADALRKSTAAMTEARQLHTADNDRANLLEQALVDIGSTIRTTIATVRTPTD